MIDKGETSRKTPIQASQSSVLPVKDFRMENGSPTQKRTREGKRAILVIPDAVQDIRSLEELQQAQIMAFSDIRDKFDQEEITS